MGCFNLFRQTNSILLVSEDIDRSYYLNRHSKGPNIILWLICKVYRKRLALPLEPGNKGNRHRSRRPLLQHDGLIRLNFASPLPPPKFEALRIVELQGHNFGSPFMHSADYRNTVYPDQSIREKHMFYLRGIRCVLLSHHYAG